MLIIVLVVICVCSVIAGTSYYEGWTCAVGFGNGCPSSTSKSTSPSTSTSTSTSTSSSPSTSSSSSSTNSDNLYNLIISDLPTTQCITQARALADYYSLNGFVVTDFNKCPSGYTQLIGPTQNAGSVVCMPSNFTLDSNNEVLKNMMNCANVERMGKYLPLFDLIYNFVKTNIIISATGTSTFKVQLYEKSGSTCTLPFDIVSLPNFSINNIINTGAFTNFINSLQISTKSGILSNQTQDSIKNIISTTAQSTVNFATSTLELFYCDPSYLKLINFIEAPNFVAQIVTLNIIFYLSVNSVIFDKQSVSGSSTSGEFDLSSSAGSSTSSN